MAEDRTNELRGSTVAALQTRDLQSRKKLHAHVHIVAMVQTVEIAPHRTSQTAKLRRKLVRARASQRTDCALSARCVSVSFTYYT